MTTISRKDVPQLDAFDEELKAVGLQGSWVRGTPEEDARTYDVEPHTRVQPYLWKWNTVHRYLMQAAESRGLEGKVERRRLDLMNPAYADEQTPRNRTTTHTMEACIQILKPGEFASNHRHNFAAFRFVIKGSGAYTVVDGEKLPMEEGDLILTPAGRWHGHGNDTEPIIWLDGLDYPLVQLLQTTTWEAFPKEFQDIMPDSEASQHRFGAARPAWREDSEPVGPLSYKWNDTYRTLQSLSGSKGSAYDGVILEYVNPRNGGHTFPTMACNIQLLRSDEKTKTHRHRHTTVYHAFRGEGTTTIDGRSFHWTQGDCFVVPLWSWHKHENRSKSDEAILFSMTDLPVMEAMGLWKEETQA
jgi:gentisate 1,2-dioxygenase